MSAGIPVPNRGRFLHRRYVYRHFRLGEQFLANRPETGLSNFGATRFRSPTTGHRAGLVYVPNGEPGLLRTWRSWDYHTKDTYRNDSVVLLRVVRLRVRISFLRRA